MNQTPRCHPRRIVFAPARRTLKQSEDRAGGLVKLRVLPSLDQNGSEHQAKETSLLQGEVDIGETDSVERIALLRRGLHRRGEFSEAFRGDRRNKSLLVVEMSIRGGWGHPDAPGGLP